MVGSMTSSTGPLSDLVVVDLSRALAGPHATMMLGDLLVEAGPREAREPGGGHAHMLLTVDGLTYWLGH